MFAECKNGQVVLLIDGQLPEVNQTEGRVEVCINNTYTAVCDDLWDEYEAVIVCQQLGFNVSISAYCATSYVIVITCYVKVITCYVKKTLNM